MWTGALGALAYVLVGGGLALMALAIYGMARLPDTYMQLQAASKAAALGLAAVLAASVASGDLATIGRAALIAVFLVLTAPVAAHAIAAAARARGEPMHGRDPLDESQPSSATGDGGAGPGR